MTIRIPPICSCIGRRVFPVKWNHAPATVGVRKVYEKTSKEIQRMVDETKKKYTKEISSDFVKFGVKPTDGSDDDSVYVTELMGTLDAVESVIMQGKPVGKYKITNAETGNVTAFLGSVLLDDKLSLVEIGTDILIEYTGSEKSATPGHSPTKQFKVTAAE